MDSQIIPPTVIFLYKNIVKANELFSLNCKKTFKLSISLIIHFYDKRVSLGQ